MKRLIVVLLAALLLTACGGKSAQVISVEAEEDAMQVIKVYGDANAQEREFTEDEETILSDYLVKYDKAKLTKSEKKLHSNIKTLIDNHEPSESVIIDQTRELAKYDIAEGKDHR